MVTDIIPSTFKEKDADLSSFSFFNYIKQENVITVKDIILKSN